MAQCPHCKQPVDAQGQKYKGKLYHPQCIEAMKQLALRKDSVRSRQLNDPDLKTLTDYLCGVFSIPALTPLLQKQIDDLHVTYSYSELLLASKYFFMHDRGSREQQGSPSIGILPYVMEDAKAFFATISAAEQAGKAFSNEQRTVTIRVHRPSSSEPWRVPMESL